MKKNIAILVFVSLPALLSAYDVTGDTKKEYYEIEGSTVKELIAEMKSKSKVDGGYFAKAYCSWKTDCKKFTSSCIVRLPKWKKPKDAKPKTVEAWDKFYSSLITHEEGHVEVFKKYFQPAYEKAEGKDCKTAKAIYQEAQQKISAENKNYDAATEHGKTQGAIIGGNLQFQSIAFSKSTGKHGSASGQSKREDADSAAVSKCGATDCKTIIWAKNACASLAVGSKKGFGHAWHEKKERAEQDALKNCRKYDKDCEVVSTACDEE